ncbi:hypothetical protein N7G274_004374 [Stereocaulon virgatum]|uniref:Uncharacterized protein n=1 Tax=Stereocaulon virgatum TaxID=373712 RepID=A0ABR4ABX8_9LECA
MAGQLSGAGKREVVEKLEGEMSRLEEISKEISRIFNQTDEYKPHGCGEHIYECEMGEIEATSGRLPLLDNLEREIPGLEMALDEESDALMRSKTFHGPDSGTETADSLFAATSARVSTMERLDIANGVKKACMLAINELDP